MVNQKIVMIMAGGTGGHVIPALEIAKRLQEKNYTVQWMGTAHGIEADLVPKKNITLHYLRVKGFRGKGLWSKLTAIWNLGLALFQAIKILHKTNPALVLGMGGYASGPGGIAAYLLRIPIVVHEQNAVAGTTNRYLSKVADRVLSAFPDAFSAAANAVTVGNPIRSEITSLPLQLDHLTRSSKRNILILGGSRGALSMNQIIPEAIHKLKDLELEVWHQVGEHAYDETKKKYVVTGLSVKVDKFIDDMASAYRWADIIICRAGAMTTFEVMNAGAAVIFIPFPFAVDDHQTKNASFLVDKDAALLMPQQLLAADSLSEVVRALVMDVEKISSLASAAYALRDTAAAENIMSHCLEVMHA